MKTPNEPIDKALFLTEEEIESLNHLSKKIASIIEKPSLSFVFLQELEAITKELSILKQRKYLAYINLIKQGYLDID